MKRPLPSNVRCLTTRHHTRHRTLYSLQKQSQRFVLTNSFRCGEVGGVNELTTAQKLRESVSKTGPWNYAWSELRLQAANELEALQKEVAAWKEHAGQSDKELCQLQDALGCPAESRNCHCDCGWVGYNQNACPKCKKETHDDGIADAQELAMNRLRDLIAEEGEAGDLRTQNEALQNRTTELKAFCDDVEGLLQAERNQNQELRDQLKEASVLIEKIGTTGVERTDIILKAEQWLKDQP